jgi:5-methyltetrahydrofolate--homocysteine methyltransferase
MQLSAPREEPWEAIPEVPQPEGWVTDYSTSDLEYHLYVRYRGVASQTYLGEAAPIIAPGDEAPNTLALYLGCRGHEMPGTVWCEPFLDDPDEAAFACDLENSYWKFTQEAGRRALEFGRGKFLCQFPDLIEGLDTLAAMRGTERLLADLIDRPEWVHACLRQITDRYFYYYDLLYDRYRDEVGGSFFWAWAPGRMAKFQCDFSAMISPAMFAEFMAPVLREMTARVGYCMYHWDGPGAIGHKAVLFALPDLDMLQWTPGAGAPPTYDPHWFPLYHEVLDAGKKLLVGANSREDLEGYKREFGEQTKQMLINGSVASVEEGEEWLKVMEM